VPLVYQLETQTVSQQRFTDFLKNISVPPSYLEIGLEVPNTSPEAKQN